jgi:hypothetical protein
VRTKTLGARRSLDPTSTSAFWTATGALAEMYAPTDSEGAAAREIAARAASVMTREGRCVVCIRVRGRRVYMRGVKRLEEDGDHARGLTGSPPPAWCRTPVGAGRRLNDSRAGQSSTVGA